MSKLSSELNATKKVITDALDQLKITNVHVEWSGGGDSGQVDSVTAKDAEQDVEIDLEKSSAMEVDRVVSESIDSGRKRKDGTPIYIQVKKTVKQTVNLEELISTFAEDLWDHFGQGGWYNNEGGQGHMEFQWDKKKKVWVIHFEHDNNETVATTAVNEDI